MKKQEGAMIERQDKLDNPEVLERLTEKQVTAVERLLRSNSRWDGGFYEIKNAEINPPEYTNQAFLVVNLGMPEFDSASITRHYCIGPRGGLKTYNGRRWFAGWQHFSRTANYGWAK